MKSLLLAPYPEYVSKVQLTTHNGLFITYFILYFFTFGIPFMYASTKSYLLILISSSCTPHSASHAVG